MASKLDPSVTKVLNAILAKDISALTDNDRIFLRARSAYLSRSQKANYGDILNPSGKELRQEAKDQRREDQAKEAASEQSKEDQNEHFEPVEDDQPIG